MIAVDTSTRVGLLQGDGGEDADIEPGYWQRAFELRAKVLAKRRKARLGDALIAQSCMDRGIPLLTRDRDFHAFAEAAGLDLVIGSAPG